MAGKGTAISGVCPGFDLWAGKLRGNFRADFYRSTLEGESQCGLGASRPGLEPGT